MMFKIIITFICYVFTIMSKYENRELATDLLERYVMKRSIGSVHQLLMNRAKVLSKHLNLAIIKNDEKILDMLVKGGGVLTKEQLLIAVTNQNHNMFNYIFNKKVSPEKEDIPLMLKHKFENEVVNLLRTITERIDSVIIDAATENNCYVVLKYITSRQIIGINFIKILKSGIDDESFESILKSVIRYGDVDQEKLIREACAVYKKNEFFLVACIRNKLHLTYSTCHCIISLNDKNLINFLFDTYTFNYFDGLLKRQATEHRSDAVICELVYRGYNFIDAIDSYEKPETQVFIAEMTSNYKIALRERLNKDLEVMLPELIGIIVTY